MIRRPPRSTRTDTLFPYTTLFRAGMSMEPPELDRDALLALLDRMLRAEAVTDAPPAAERGDWLYGSAGFTEPDEYGWMAPAPPADIWVPRALVLWRMAILRSEERSVGTECVSTCRSLGLPYP